MEYDFVAYEKVMTFLNFTFLRRIEIWHRKNDVSHDIRKLFTFYDSLPLKNPSEYLLN